MLDRGSTAARGRERRSRRVVCGLLALILGGLASGAHAGSPKQVYDRMLAKIPRISDAAVGRFKPRHACACLTPGSLFAGVVMMDEFDTVRCVKIGFTPEGEILSFFLCNEFTVIGR